MVICDVCERGWHTSCCNPALDAVPQDDWRCYACAKCQGGCGKLDIASNESVSSNMKDWLIKGMIAESAPDAEVAPFVKAHGDALLGLYCQQCRENAGQGRICGLCTRTWAADMTFENEVRRCTGCQTKVHTVCDPSADTLIALQLSHVHRPAPCQYIF